VIHQRQSQEPATIVQAVGEKSMLYLSLGTVATGRIARNALTHFRRFFVRTSRASSL
jgi:hypothetical protein